MIEVEKKAILTEQSAHELKAKILSLGGKDLGENNTRAVFFIDETTQIKVAHNVNKKTAKIAWKSGSMGQSHIVEEIEIPIATLAFDDAVKMLQKIAPQLRKFDTAQERHDYELGGIYIAIKYSDDWGHHAELDRNVNSEDEVTPANNAINGLAKKLEIKLLSQKEESEHVTQMLARRNASN